MKNIALTDKQFEQLLSSLSFREAIQVVNLLSKKIELEKETLNIPIEELDLSPHTYQVVKNAKLNTVADIMAFDLVELGLLNRIGLKTLTEIQEKIFNVYPLQEHR
jgi:DNA-directed RNA polymerase alpha subunit